MPSHCHYSLHQTLNSGAAYSFSYFASRWKVASVATVLLLVAIAGFYVHSRSNGPFANTNAKSGAVTSGQSSASPSSQFEAGNASVENRDPKHPKPVPPRVEDEKSAFVRAMVDNDNARFAAENDPIITPEISAAEERKVVTCLERAEAEFRRMEQANTRLVDEAGSVDEAGNETGRIVIYMTSAPNLEQYRAYVDTLDSATAGLSQFVKDAIYPRGKRLLDTYASYPAPYTLKVVVGGFSYREDEKPGTPERRNSFTESYVLKEDAVSLGEDGSVNYSIGGRRGRRFGDDRGLSRYGYVFEKYLPAGIEVPGKK